MSSGESVRVKLSFSDLFTTVKLKLSKCWFQVNFKRFETLGDLTESIIAKFGIPVDHNIQLTLDGCVLPKWETPHILRDNDSICVTVCEHFGYPHSPHNSYGVVETNEVYSATDDATEKFLSKGKRKKNKVLSSVIHCDVDIHKKLGFDENYQKKKSKKHKKHLFVIGENDVDNDIQQEHNVDENQQKRSSSKPRHKKMKLDGTVHESNEAHATLTDLQDKSVESIHLENCARSASCIDSDMAPNDIVNNSMVSGSLLYFHNEESPDNKSACLVGKLNGDSACVQLLQTYKNNNITPKLNSSMASLLNISKIISSSVSTKNVCDVAHDSALLVDSQKPSRKKRRTRRRRSKLAASNMEPKANDELVCVGESKSACSDVQMKAKEDRQDSLGPTPNQGHIIFKENSCSDESEEGADLSINRCSSDRLEGTAVSSSDTKCANTDNHATLFRLAQGDQIIVNRGGFSQSVQSLCISDTSTIVQSSGSETLSTSSLITGSEFSGRAHIGTNRSKKNSPFGNVQIFCRQKLKKMPSVSWDSCSQATSPRDAITLCSGLESCLTIPKLGADDSFMGFSEVGQPVVKNYSKCISLPGPPCKGNVIAYKILQMAEDYSPCLSDFQEATVLSYNTGTGIVHLKRMLVVSKKKTPGRFDLTVEYEDEILTNTDVVDSTDIKVAWCALHDVRLVEDGASAN